MDALYEFDVDPARHLVRQSLRGFFTPSDLGGYLLARTAAFGQLRCPITHHLALTDVREMRIQSQDMVNAWSQVLADPRTRARRLAFVVATSLARQQLRRAIGRRDAQCFLDAGEAESWLLSVDDAVRAA